MSKHEKLLARLLTQPTDFIWDELLRLLKALGYEELSAGKTGGSRRAFVNAATSVIIRLHKPHPGNILKQYQLKQIIQQLNLNKP
ncbi:hypothetical protein GCM10023185_44330 [Hymenobacter saemangeumensis]|uniref:Type II toxin-antitoxin system HicA family toxin n=1 Tax=Hymenobacter saemangeumensis TaxID=1084522 RepID=A0ABP8IS83_9BACT